MGKVVVILYADDVCNSLRLLYLRSGDIAESQVPNQALALHFGQRGERFFDGRFGGRGNSPSPEINHVQSIYAKIAQVVMHRTSQLGRTLRRIP
ncbi:hypothetical protein D3C76_1531570 [compost metagenome]